MFTDNLVVFDRRTLIMAIGVLNSVNNHFQNYLYPLDKVAIQDNVSDPTTFGSVFDSIRTNRLKAPYSHLADANGQIHYTGVTFTCSKRYNMLTLGCADDAKKNVLNIPLSCGGVLKVHRDFLGDLAKAIDMFSPEDVNRIMRALAQDAKIAQTEQEIEEEKKIHEERIEEEGDL
jgi:hypothetical protein